MINNSNLIPWLGIKWNMATIYSIHYIPKFVFLENVCRVLLHPLPIRHVYHLVLQGVDSINEPIFKKSSIYVIVMGIIKQVNKVT